MTNQDPRLVALGEFVDACLAFADAYEGIFVGEVPVTPNIAATAMTDMDLLAGQLTQAVEALRQVS
jgi:hypothetical protein